MSIAVRFDDMHADSLEHSLERAPRFERFAPAAKHAIRVIHGLPALFEARSLGEIEVYIGRTAYDQRSLRGRWRDHAAHRRHEFGVVLFECPTDRVQVWERAANRLVKRLQSRRALCVANALAGGQGPLPAAARSCIYLTWRFKRRTRCTPVLTRDLERLAVEVHCAGRDEPTLDSWRRALAPLPTPAEREVVRWSW